MYRTGSNEVFRIACHIFAMSFHKPLCSAVVRVCVLRPFSKICNDPSASTESNISESTSERNRDR